MGDDEMRRADEEFHAAVARQRKIEADRPVAAALARQLGGHAWQERGEWYLRLSLDEAQAVADRLGGA